MVIFQVLLFLIDNKTWVNKAKAEWNGMMERFLKEVILMGKSMVMGYLFGLMVYFYSFFYLIWILMKVLKTKIKGDQYEGIV